MRKLFLSLAVFVMALCANAQTNQYFWYQGNLMMGNPIAQIDSVTFGEGEPADTLNILLPRTIIKTVRETIKVEVHDTLYITKYTCASEGALEGEFSVSTTKKVRFSRGNLQYVGSWQFAENQWDYFGDSQSDNHRDLFGWGTGDAPNKVSTNDNDYTVYAEWGDNPISNGGNTAKIWRTLTKDEYTYLFYDRKDAAKLFSFGRVNGVNGIILLPDNWTLPTSISFITSTTQGLTDLSDHYYNESGNNYTHNAYTSEQWAIMESAGAVFLPTAGYRDNTDVGDVDSIGIYWSATSCYDGRSYGLGFSSHGLYPQFMYHCYRGRSVRLTKDVE